MDERKSHVYLVIQCMVWSNRGNNTVYPGPRLSYYPAQSTYKLTRSRGGGGGGNIFVTWEDRTLWQHEAWLPPGHLVAATAMVCKGRCSDKSSNIDSEMAANCVKSVLFSICQQWWPNHFSQISFEACLVDNWHKTWPHVGRTKNVVCKICLSGLARLRVRGDHQHGRPRVPGGARHDRGAADQQVRYQYIWRNMFHVH